MGVRLVIGRGAGCSRHADTEDEDLRNGLRNVGPRGSPPVVLYPVAVGGTEDVDRACMSRETEGNTNLAAAGEFLDVSHRPPGRGSSAAAARQELLEPIEKTVGEVFPPGKNPDLEICLARFVVTCDSA